MGTQIMGMASAGVGATITRAGIIRIPEKRGVMFGGLKRRRNTAEICGRRRGIGDTHTSEWICKAIEPTTETPTTYQGFYGPWTIDPSDIREGLVQFVVDNPTAIWFTGPIFASLTGLVIKEGLCYGKLEAAVLAFIIPTCLLGHLTGTMDNELKTFLLGVWVSFFAVFSGRKFTQPFKDDIGDKSVFMFNALPEEEKAVLEKSRKQKL
ncbi:uncharacterized protein LOC141644424 isoform X2 [Silene latifolia]|uniref:uncharacterized protein LOC141644424 isoform X2 n=1 Tax=Silene latifolia TaxID=37657 RepID=UPI003D788595